MRGFAVRSFSETHLIALMIFLVYGLNGLL